MYGSFTDRPTSILSRQHRRSLPASGVWLESRRVDGCRFIASQTDIIREPNFQVAKEIKDRLEELQGAGIDLYPRDVTSYRAWSLLQFERDHRSLKEGEIKKSARLGSCQGSLAAPGHGVYE